MKAKQSKNCKNCGIEYTPTSQSKFCSNECREEHSDKLRDVASKKYRDQKIQRTFHQSVEIPAWRIYHVMKRNYLDYHLTKNRVLSITDHDAADVFELCKLCVMANNRQNQIELERTRLRNYSSKVVSESPESAFALEVKGSDSFTYFIDYVISPSNGGLFRRDNMVLLKKQKEQVQFIVSHRLKGYTKKKDQDQDLEPDM